MFYGIELSSSDGDRDLWGEFKTPEAAYRELCKKVCNNALTENEEYDEMSVIFNAQSKTVTVHYGADNDECSYKMVYTVSEVEE